MIANEAPDYEAEKLLYQLYYEIMLLKSRVNAANPLERAKCKDQLKSLHDQYKLVEAQVLAIREARDELQIKHSATAINCLQELQELLASVGHWIWIQTAN